MGSELGEPRVDRCGDGRRKGRGEDGQERDWLNSLVKCGKSRWWSKVQLQCRGKLQVNVF